MELQCLLIKGNNDSKRTTLHTTFITHLILRMITKKTTVILLRGCRLNSRMNVTSEGMILVSSVGRSAGVLGVCAISQRIARQL
jgi:hypothetical protein